MVLTSMKRSIKGLAQEIVLHLGEDGTVSDILTRFEMMFGDVDPPHVLSAHFYNLEHRQEKASLISILESRILLVISSGRMQLLFRLTIWDCCQYAILE